jgi:hypothetical protein
VGATQRLINQSEASARCANTGRARVVRQASPSEVQGGRAPLEALHFAASSRQVKFDAAHQPDGTEGQTGPAESSYAHSVSRYEYDEEASAVLHMDVVHEVRDDGPVPVTRWVDAMRRLNGVTDPLARQLLQLHQDCGSGRGVCGSVEDDLVGIARRSGWGCETTEIIAGHFGIEYPEPPKR